MRATVKLWLVASVVAALLAPFFTWTAGWSIGALHWGGLLLDLVLSAWPVLWVGVATVVFFRVKTLPWFAAGAILGCCFAMVLVSPLLLAAMAVAGGL
jgi:hypothetical protein